jgi:peroxiredoxin
MKAESGVSRRGKVVFAVFAAASLLFILGSKAWQVFVEPDELSARYLGIEGVGGPAAPFELLRHDGATVKLADYQGRFVLLNFWATWCDSCRTEMPSMAALASRLRADKLAMVAATVDEGWEPVDRFFGARAPPFDVLRDPESKWAKTYGTVKFPETYLIGPDGKLRAKFVGPRDWSDKAFELYFRKQLAEISPTDTPRAAN